MEWKKTAGVLLLKDSKIYETVGKKNYYRCLPFDKNLPSFILPYQIKYNFSKVFENKYVVFRYQNQNDATIWKGVLDETIGNVSDYNAYIKWILVANSLFFPKLKLQNDISFSLFQNKFPHRESKYVFSIDPEGCTDFDDAFSLQDNILSIYISNVPFFLEKLNLYEKLASQINTIYLPQNENQVRTKHLLPTELAENYCSLRADGLPKTTIVLDLNLETGIYSLQNCRVTIQENFVYGSPNLEKNSHYQHIFNACQKLDSDEKVHDCHSMVAFLMILFNSHCGNILKTGIFRETVERNEFHALSHSNDNFLYYGNYTNEKKSIHRDLRIHSYAHCSSPIRRTVDIVNLIRLQQQEDLFSFSNKALQFASFWQENTNYINETCKKIKRVENQANVLHLLKDEKSLLVDGTVLGYERENEMVVQYHVFFPEYKFSANVRAEPHFQPTADKIQCKIVKLCDENLFYQKIRICMVSKPPVDGINLQ